MASAIEMAVFAELGICDSPVFFSIRRNRNAFRPTRAAMRAVYTGKTVRCALVFADGVLSEV